MLLAWTSRAAASRTRAAAGAGHKSPGNGYTILEGANPTHGMFTVDDQHAHFLGTVSDLCLAAELGRLEVELVTTDGARARGVPTSLDGPGGEHWSSGLTHGGQIRLDDLAVRLDEVVECTVLASSKH